MVYFYRFLSGALLSVVVIFITMLLPLLKKKLIRREKAPRIIDVIVTVIGWACIIYPFICIFVEEISPYGFLFK